MRGLPFGTAPPVEARALGVEQSNSSIVLDDTLIVKLYRRVEAGVNPEIELLHFFGRRGFENVPKLWGWWSYAGTLMDASLGVVQQFAPSSVDGWSLALEELGSDPETFKRRLRRLGEVIGQMHTVLASEPDNPAFAPEEASQESLALLAATVDEEIDQVFRSLPEDNPAVEPIAGRADDVRDLLRGLATVGSIGLRIRTHGDLHLGQLLWSQDDWLVIDFEGEPARPLPERRLKQSPLRDVAGILRSFSYAASVVGIDGHDLETSARAEFLDGYMQTAQVATVMPPYEVDRSPPADLRAGEGRLRAALRTCQQAGLGPCPGQRHSPSARGIGLKVDEEAELILARDHPDPHHYLGAHPRGKKVVVRAFAPNASRVRVLLEGGEEAELEQVHPGGLFEAKVAPESLPAHHRLAISYPDGLDVEIVDPYTFLPTLGELDVHLAAEGRHEHLYEKLGARIREVDGVTGTAFAVWAPNARSVSVVGDFNSWDGLLHPMRTLGASGIWELFVPGVEEWAHYKFELRHQDGSIHLKADPVAQATETPPLTASLVFQSRHEWEDADWLESRRASQPLAQPISIYEVHLGSWRQGLTYAEAAEQLGAYVRELGFTHVELLPIMEHPFSGSWGYQVTGFFAPTSRFGTPDEFRAFVDSLHRQGIGVILDWVPAHFPRDEWALARFDGTALYEHSDPRRGAHPDWGTLVFNVARNEVRNFLLASGLLWLEEYHADGLRIDAVASMLYLDYSRKPGQWVPNIHGGREDLDNVAFLRELNERGPRDGARNHLRRRGVDLVARRLAAGLPGRPRLRLQVEHGVDARHARLLRERPGVPPLPPQRVDVLDDLRLHRELHPAALPRRGRPWEGVAAREDAGRPVAEAREPARAVRVHVGPPRQEAPVHGLRARPGDGVEPRLVSRLAPPGPARARRRSAARARSEPPLPR